MNERHLYRGLNNFEGSIDEDGTLYDEHHSPVGRIEGNDVYDHHNIKQGTINANGELRDIEYNYVGQAHGNNFIGPTYQSTGMTRGDSFGEGNGCEYGALMMLKKRNEYYYGKHRDSDYNFPDSYGGDDDKDQDDYDNDVDDDSGDDDRRDYDSKSISTSYHAPMRNGRGNGCSSPADDTTGCITTLFFILFFGGLILYLLLT